MGRFQMVHLCHCSLLSYLIDISDEDEEYDLSVTGKVGACAAKGYNFLSAMTQNINANGLPVKFELKK